MLSRRLATTIHAHCRAKLRSKAWYFGTSNVRSLVDNKGTVETARLSSEVSESEYRRIDPSHHRTEPLQKKSLVSKRHDLGMQSTMLGRV